jgi:hypothetical protein
LPLTFVQLFIADRNSRFVNLFAPGARGATLGLESSPALGTSGIDFTRPGEGAREHGRRTGGCDAITLHVPHRGRP